VDVHSDSQVHTSTELSGCTVLSRLTIFISLDQFEWECKQEVVAEQSAEATKVSDEFLIVLLEASLVTAQGGY